MPRTRIAIIGAGPAGSACAATLCQSRFRVTIIESRPFPRSKVCGEFISPAATELLEDLIPAPRLLEAGASRVGELTLCVNHRAAAWHLPTPAWALSRAALDSLLLDRARSAGATILQPAPVREVRYGAAPDEPVSVSLADSTLLSADVVIHADGSGRHDPAGPTPTDSSFIAHKCHLRVPEGTIRGVHMRSCPGGYVGTIGVERGLSTCALAARRSLIARFSGDSDAMLTSLWPDFRPEWREGDWMACPLQRSNYIKPGHPRSFRIGNAAAAVDPIGGEGIGLALWSGVMLAGLLNESAPAHSALPLRDLVPLHRLFTSAYRRRLRVRLPACRLAAEVLLRPNLTKALWPLLAFPSMTLGSLYSLTGKSPHRAAARSPV